MLDIQSLFDIISIGFEEDNEKSQALWVYVCDLNLKKLWTMVSYSSKKKKFALRCKLNSNILCSRNWTEL